MTFNKNKMGQTNINLFIDTFSDWVDVNYLAGFIWRRLCGSCWSAVGHGVLPVQGKTLWVAWGLSGCSSHRDVLDRDAVGSDVVDLARCRDIDQVVGLNLNLIPRRQESVKPHDEVRMALEEL